MLKPRVSTTPFSSKKRASEPFLFHSRISSVALPRTKNTCRLQKFPVAVILYTFFIEKIVVETDPKCIIEYNSALK